MTDQDLFTQQRHNRRRSALLVAGFVLFFAWIGFGGDLTWYLATRDLAAPAYRHVVPFLGLIATALAAAVAWYSWQRGAHRVLGATGAWELLDAGDDRQRRLLNVVDEMTIASGLPRPRVWVVPDPDPNAFATGLGPEASHVAVTEGLLGLLDRDELQGVVAHEMAHIRNYDVRLMTLIAAMVGTIALMSDTLRRFLRFGGRPGRGRPGGKSDGRGSPLVVIVLVLWLVSLVVAPLVARGLAMAVSRKREYLADATAAQFTRHPDALARALTKLDGAVGATRSIGLGVAHMCIVDPGERRLAAREGALGNLLASHPPIRLRVARLRGMAYQAEKAALAAD